MSIRWLLAGLGLGTAVPSYGVGQAAVPTKAVLNADNMLRVAEGLERAGRRVDAERVLRALLKDRDSNLRIEARFRLAQLLQRRGATTGAVLELRRLVDEQPDVATPRFLLARLLADLGQMEAARRELRALSSSRLPREFQAAVDRFEDALRASRPWGASVELTLAPDTNINRATRSDTVGTIIGDFRVEEDGMAKSGLGLTLKAQAHRQIELGNEHSLLLRAASQADMYRASEFNDVAVDFSAGPQFRIGRANVGIAGGLTKRWFGRKPFVDAVRVAAALAVPVGRRMQLRLNGSAASIDNHLNDLQDGRSYGVEVIGERAFSRTFYGALNFSANRVSAADQGYSTRGWRSGFSIARELGRNRLTLGAEFGRLRADRRLGLFPDKRSDQSSRYSIGVTNRQLSVAGFAPVGRVIFERNRSSIEFYDYRRTRTELGIVRAL